MIIESQLYTITQLQQFLPLCKKTIYELIKRGELSAHNTSQGKRPFYLVSGKQINDYLTKINHEGHA